MKEHPSGLGAGSSGKLRSRADDQPRNDSFKKMCEEGLLEEALQLLNQQDLVPNRESYLLLLQGCIKVKSLDTAKHVHAHLVQNGFESDSYLGNSVVNMLVKCGGLSDALLAFSRLRQRNAFSWTAIISCYSSSGQSREALEMYQRMRAEGVKPSKYTFISLLKACGSLGDLEKGREIHKEIAENGCVLDAFVGTTLIDMYAKCGSMLEARQVFENLAQRDVVSWTAMIAGYAQEGLGHQALQMYAQMQAGRVQPNDRTFVSVLKACGSLAAAEEESLVAGQSLKLDSLHRGRLIHAEIRKSGFEQDMFVGNTLVDMYAKCGSMVDATRVFEALPQPNVVSWTALIAGYVHQEQGESALQLYMKMQEEGLLADEATFLCLLKACSHVGALRVCSRIHQDIVKKGAGLTVTLSNTLIHAYGKCGSMAEAQHVFDLLPHPNLVSWTALVAGYARQGECSMSLQCFEQMQQAGIEPGPVTFLSVMTACCHAGLVERGIEFLRSMITEYSITPTVRHYASLVDLLARAGHLKLAEDCLLKMPVQPDLVMWLSLLGACRKFNDLEIGWRAFRCAVRLDPKQSSAYVLMRNIYIDAHMWEEANRVEELRGLAGAWQKPGQTWIEDKNMVHTFLVRDGTHQQRKQIYFKLRELGAQLKGLG